MTSAREQTTPRQLLEQLKKAVPMANGLVLTTLPRGGLQIMQPSSVTDSVVKRYASELHTEDCLTWQTIFKRKPQKLSDCWTNKELENSSYFRTWLQPMGLAHVVSLPLGGPALDGYPGAVHVCRTSEQGEFTPQEVHKMSEVVSSFDERLASARAAKRSSCAPAIPGVERPQVRLTILDSNLKAKAPAAANNQLDDRIRDQMVEQAKRRMNQLNGDTSVADRVMLSDAHGDRWPYRVVTFKRYPALGQGPVSFFCLQPDCGEWGILRPTDFQADAELVRLIPALRYMQQEFHKGATLVDIARTVHLSPFHFHRRFTELLGLTPKQYLLDCQIHLAKTELLAGEKELATIAKECGFAHQSHFTSRFKQATGYTPTRWRKMALARRQYSDN